ncbi:MAG: hypothetical protein ACRDHY_11870 [Anaerolineales bacterium]
MTRRCRSRLRQNRTRRVLPAALVVVGALLPGAAHTQELATLFAQPLASGTVTLAFDERAVVASGLTAGGQVAWFGVAREPVNFGAAVVRREALLADEDADGKVRFELDRAVPFRSIWVAVDLTSGESAIGTPAGYPLRPLKLGVNAFLSRGLGKVDLFTESRDFLQVFVVRPKSGAWVLSAVDGSAEDQDGPANGSVTLDTLLLEPVGKSPPAPDGFAKDDVFVAIDPNRMEAVAVRLVGLNL